MNNSVVADRILEVLGSAPGFDLLPGEVRQRVLGEVMVRYFEAGSVVLNQGRTSHESLYVVESGFVRLINNETGRLVDEYGEADVFGNYGLMRGGALPYEARAVEPTVCLLLGAESFRELYEAHHHFAAFFDRDLSERSPDDGAIDAGGSRLLFGTRLGNLVGRAPVTCAPGNPVLEAARIMRREGMDSVLVVEDGEVIGILSDSDLRNRLVAEAAPVQKPVEALMSRHVLRLEAHETVFEALMQMMHHGASHVVVSEGSGARERLLGVVSDQDISRAQGNSPVFVTERVERTHSLAGLTRIRPETDQLLLGLERQGVKSQDLITINTEINDRLMPRVLVLVEEELKSESPEMYVDLPWAWLSLGSEGRGEMGLLTDQDNALVYADPATEEEARRAEQWFSTLAERANHSLARCGFALCEGGIMAKNPEWRHSLSGWKEIFQGWTLHTDSETLMRASTFFDLRGLYGDMSLVEELKRYIQGTLEREQRFMPFMVQNVLANRPPLSFFRRFLLERSGEYRHTFNIKRRGLRPLVDAARVLAIQLRYLESASTVGRFRQVSREMPDLAPMVNDALDAYHYLSELRFVHQLRAIEQGGSPDNQINPSDLNGTQQDMLKVVFSTSRNLQETLAYRYGLDTRT